jgi:hypothetical protein
VRSPLGVRTGGCSSLATISKKKHIINCVVFSFPSMCRKSSLNIGSSEYHDHCKSLAVEMALQIMCCISFRSLRFYFLHISFGMPYVGSVVTQTKFWECCLIVQKSTGDQTKETNRTMEFLLFLIHCNSGRLKTLVLLWRNFILM